VTELLSELRSIELLAGIDDSQLESIARVVTTERVAQDEVLVAEGTVGEDLYFVRNGRFRVTVMDGDSATEVAQLGAGNVIGESQLIAGGRRTATVTAMEPCEVLRLPHAEFDALVIASEPLRNSVARVIRHRLREAALRVALPHAVGSDPELLDMLSERATWVRLGRGESLWEQGEPADSWYVIVSGELSTLVTEHGATRKIESIRRGEVFGEIGLIRGTARTTTAIATRDSWLARFDARLLHDEILNRTGALQTLVVSLANRLSAQSRSGKGSARTMALLPRDSGLDTKSFIRLLSHALGEHGLVVDADSLHRDGVVGNAANLPSEHPAWLRFEAWVESRRQDLDYLLFVTSGEDNPWTRAAVEQADTVLLLVDADMNPARSDFERSVLDRLDTSQAPPVWLILEHPADRAMPAGTAAWLDLRNLAHHAHVRKGNLRDISRLARWLTGRTRGMALSGGGARGFVHLGIVTAMLEAGYDVDLFAGTSAGAMAGGLLARAEDPRTMMESALKIIEAAGNPFVDFDLPLISVLRNRRMREGLHGTYREVAIEDSWIPLRILVTDLTESRRKVFDRGLIWKRVLAASSPPGIMAPVMDDGHLLCDGGLVDNLPVSVLKDENCREKWASYVGSSPEVRAPSSGIPTSGALLIDKLIRRGKHQDVPTLLSTLFQCVSVPAAAQLEDARAAADVFFQPDLSSFSVTDIKAARQMFQAGYSHAQTVLETVGDGSDDTI
jgi:NTE family protein